MSLVAFQTELARLITSPQFRRAVQQEGAAALSEELTSLERKRLLAVAASPGLEVTWKLHKGFRLNKLIGRIPLTNALLDSNLLAREISSFWEKTPPTSFYYIAEAIAFCDHLLSRAEELAVPYLEEIVAFERATLTLQLPQRDDAPETSIQIVRFEHDVSLLLEALKSGMPIGKISVQPCWLIGQRSAEGKINWVRSEVDPLANMPV